MPARPAACGVLPAFLLLALALALASSTLPARSSEGPYFSSYAVAADHPQASAAGAAVLAAGGNAADAAAAAMLALGVAHPAGSGLGGGGFALYYRASDRSLTFLDFREAAPRAVTAETFRARAGDDPEITAARSRVGGLAVAVPGEPLGIAELVSRFGTKSLAELVVPAETLAREGFVVTEHLARSLSSIEDPFAKDPLLRAVFGAARDGGDSAKNRELAMTLRRFGREGPALFYRGALAREIIRSVRARGGLLSAEDLASYRVITREPARATALGYHWVTAPSPSAGGYTLLQSLAFLERVLLSDDHWASTERQHAMIESWKGPTLDRQRYFGDPDHVAVPISELMAESRLDARASHYHPLLAVPAEAYEEALPDKPAAAQQASDHGTSHLCVVDAQGNVAAVTTTINLSFGSRIAVRGLWLNDEMDDFAREVGKENAFGLVGGGANLPAPEKRPISSMSPTIVFRASEPVLCVGGSGGSRIPTAVEQVALYTLHDGMHPLSAILAPRLHYQVAPDGVELRDVSEAVARELGARGHRLKTTEGGANVQAIRIGEAGPRRLAAASDPKKSGAPAGL